MDDDFAKRQRSMFFDTSGLAQAVQPPQGLPSSPGPVHGEDAAMRALGSMPPPPVPMIPRVPLSQRSTESVVSMNFGARAKASGPVLTSQASASGDQVITPPVMPVETIKITKKNSTIGFPEFPQVGQNYV
eukprot:1435930-Amphidinium_carterae.1